jgi:hypothetical protein
MITGDIFYIFHISGKYLRSKKMFWFQWRKIFILSPIVYLFGAERLVTGIQS